MPNKMKKNLTFLEQFFRIKSLDEKIGVFYGTFCFGISARWWKDEHMIHHALTNTVDPYSDFVDPQAMEEAWVQNELLFTQPINPVKAFCVSVSFSINACLKLPAWPCVVFLLCKKLL